jgi:hypothetical protein
MMQKFAQIVVFWFALNLLYQKINLKNLVLFKKIPDFVQRVSQSFKLSLFEL